VRLAAGAQIILIGAPAEGALTRQSRRTDVACSATVDLSPSVTGLYGYRTNTATLHFGTLPGASVPAWK